MTIDTGDLDRGPRLIVENTCPMSVLAEMAIGAMHTLFEMDVLQMDGLLEFVRIVRLYYPIARVEQISFPVLLIDVLKHPAVPVRIGELHVLQFFIEIGGTRLLQK